MLVKPTWRCEDVTCIDLDALRDAGVKGLILDLDNTLLPPSKLELSDRMRQWLLDMEAHGFQLVMVSNNPRSWFTQQAADLCQAMVIGNAGKPNVRHLKTAMQWMNLQPHEVAVVGDRPLTDIWGGNRLGAKTVWVEPLIKKIEHPVIQFCRKLEALFVHPERN